MPLTVTSASACRPLSRSCKTRSDECSRRAAALAAPLLLLAVLLCGCAGRPAAPHSLRQQAAAERLQAAAEAWRGVPYRLGGTTRQGVDCSGLAMRLYRDLFGHRLPRTTAAQARVGRRAPRDALRPGDLLVFRTGFRARHVGVYLGDGRFVHSSASRGVVLEHTAQRYWRQRLRQVRRVDGLW